MEFFLLIPIGVLLIVCLMFIGYRIYKKRKIVTLSLIIPFFLFTQVLSVIIVHNFQRHRSNNLIQELEKLVDKSGAIPDQVSTPLGINYKLSDDQSYYIIEYSRGFLITERYTSDDSEWRAHGWSD